jgi:hypothetical protein
MAFPAGCPDSGCLKDKEKAIREKLLLKLKKKAESQKGRGTKAKSGGEGLETEMSDICLTILLC